MNLDLNKWMIIKIYWVKTYFCDFLLSFLLRYCYYLKLNVFLPYNFLEESLLTLFFVLQIQNLRHLVASISSRIDPKPLDDVLFIAMQPSKPYSSKYFGINHNLCLEYAHVFSAASLRFPHSPMLSSVLTPFFLHSRYQFHIDT